MSPQIYYGLSVICILLVLTGINRMSKVEKAVSGNRLSAYAMIFAMILTLVKMSGNKNFSIKGTVALIAVLAISACIGVKKSGEIEMIAMPQTVAILNGLGGLASMLVALATAVESGHNTFDQVTSSLAIAVGALTLTGSLIAAGKLARKIDSRPKVLPGHAAIQFVLLLAMLYLIVLHKMPYLIMVLALLWGGIFVIRVGGADMPITISLLNSLSGVAGGIAGMAVQDILLVAIGGVVGASGLILTQDMCKAMNRSLGSILSGKTTVQPGKTPKKDASPKAEKQEEKPEAKDPIEVIGDDIRSAESIIIVPGYGMAISQAQHDVAALAKKLRDMGKNVKYAIHPVAGRMPGHMSVLLCEADVGYEELHMMDDINDDFKDTDLVIVIGANDVTNPAANTAEGTPIYGMPVLNIADAKKRIICNFDLKPGYAGVDNPLYKDKNTTLLLGDAKDSLRKIDGALSGEVKTAAEKKEDSNLSGALQKAENIIIVPGYGMAISQAQHDVAALAKKLRDMGKNVKYAIHPVAGRMPGHMSVLLCEADVGYEELHMMDDINDDFKDTDLAIVIGANDVTNPAANTAEGTPIYGMPVLNVADAKKRIICNFDLKPGYAGVDNPLYEDDNTILLLGDAKDSIKTIEDALSGDAVKESESKDEGRSLADTLQNAESVIVVPGYGMAISQAQHDVAAFAKKLKGMGKDVKYAIHPVAGRMPGHMSVLLCEADVGYEELHMMDDINGAFKDTDVAIVIGANDVTNPAANTAEGTPIYGMPVLNVADAKKRIICNFDLKPGYAGVDNPLYEDENTILLLGDAKDSIKKMDQALSEKPAAKEEKTEENSLAQTVQNAEKIIIVPGYGMAISQAQHDVAALAKKLKSMGKDVKYAIHPVAGRMPGHMSVLLCEADVGYEELHMMDDINDDFKDADVAIVIGANDVTNPAANTAEGTPIYGMPVLNVVDAKKRVICNFDLKPGYAGVDNPLYEDENTILLLGDAKDSIKKIDAALNEKPAAPKAKKDEKKSAGEVLKEAQKIIIVPGYGMAISQAQHDVAALAKKLKSMGKDVKYAIHPVAGRMPGHMSVLLCEADVGYEELHMMDDINDDFKDADVAIVIGANDVTNPAANTAEGTPIYGMPVLNVVDAKKRVICNFDLKPGYAGVDNPLYEDENTILLLGDAKDSIKKIESDL